jgi:hypothetical protein
VSLNTLVVGLLERGVGAALGAPPAPGPQPVQ